MRPEPPRPYAGSVSQILLMLDRLDTAIRDDAEKGNSQVQRLVSWPATRVLAASCSVPGREFQRAYFLERTPGREPGAMTQKGVP